MAEIKTRPTAVDPKSYVEAIEDDDRRKDCQALMKLMARATKQKPKMWGTAIVGFGSYRYKYASGHEGEACAAGFSSRKADITLYLAPEVLARDKALAKLGKHKTAKSCLHIRRLEDVDLEVLENLVAESYASTKRRYP